MDHAQALRTAATERYLLGEMTEEERSAFEAHFFSCAECGRDVKAATAFVEEAKAVLLEDASPPQVSPFRRLAWTAGRWSRLGWPVPVGLAAALLAVVGYQNLVQIPGMERELQRAEAPQAVGWSFVSVSRSAPQAVTVAASQRMLGLTLSRSALRSYPHYRCEVRDAGGKTVESAVVPAPAAGDELNLIVPTRRLRAGPTTVVLIGLDSPDDKMNDKTPAPEIARYSFDLQRH